MTNETARSIRKHGVILALFALAAALLVGLVNQFTRDQITAQRQAAERRALYEVLPPARHDNDLLEDTFTLAPGDTWEEIELLGLTEPRAAYVARLDGAVSGIILPAEVHDGYSGDIDLLVGIRRDGTLSGVRVLQHNETPGLGDKIDLRVSDWILDFNGRSLQNPPRNLWQVQKDGGEFDQFVGATITPRAVVNGIRRALQFFETNRDRLTAL